MSASRSNHEEPGYRGLTYSGGYPLSGADPVDTSEHPGALICIEGTDHAGRSTHIALLREWLENDGYGVVHTAFSSAGLAGAGLQKAKAGHTLGPLTMDLFYATDFADRVENEIIPALRAGFVVLTDRYYFASIARSVVRGSDQEWVEDIYRFAPKPDAVFYLDITVENLIPRVLSSGGFDYWESGMDFQEERDIYTSFVRYQDRLLKVFGDMVDSFGLTRIDANRGIRAVFADLKESTMNALHNTGVRPSLPKLEEDA
ncbi:MAG: dTMP kinase [Phycisphaerales bacterium JB061]